MYSVIEIDYEDIEIMVEHEEVCLLFEAKMFHDQDLTVDFEPDRRLTKFMLDLTLLILVLPLDNNFWSRM